ncbi:MAG: amidohydrolase [Armatimonadota bacterium]|nr:amidohydrolase [Armatimonadota bacterium]
MPSVGSRRVLENGVVVTMNPDREIFAPGVVVMAGERLAYVGPASGWTSRPGDEVVDCRGLLLMPGLINTHTHTALALLRGLAEDRPRESWGTIYGLPYLDRMQPGDYYWGAMLGGLEMLTNGITCIADRLSGMAAIAPAFDRIGLRAVLCHTLWDLGQPLEWDRALDLMQDWGTDRERRIHCGIGPHAPNTCSDGLLRRCRALADETGARLFIHCAQSEPELAAMRARGYASPVDGLAKTGILGRDAVLAHCLYVNDTDIDLLASSGAWVAHCPVSNAKIEGRVAPVAAMMRAGVRVALATDWAPTNNGMDLFDEMKCAGVLNKVAADDPRVVPVARLLEMTTIDAARALGLDEQIGSLEAGKRADVIALAMDGLHLQPWQEVPATLVYSAKGLDVRHVWVDGQPVVAGRRPTRADPDEVREQISRIWRRLRSDH